VQALLFRRASFILQIEDVALAVDHFFVIGT
jgi:hypothetical protein